MSMADIATPTTTTTTATAFEPQVALRSTRPRHILMLNWRDITHPQGGGAETVTHQIARRWVEWGHQVTLFCASYPGSQAEERIDGVRVVRRGRQQTVHWEAYRFYRKEPRGRYDVIVDQVNTIPFFAPLYAREPVVMFIHQLAREVWRYEASFPLSTMGYLCEPLYLQAYRRTPIMTVSQSTRDDLRRLGLPGPYRVIPEAVDTPAPEVIPPLETKERTLTLVFVGRIVPSKRVTHIVGALKLIRQAGLSEARLWIVGSWEEAYRARLDDQIAALGLGDAVTFFGRVDQMTRDDVLARAHIFVMTSVREGWGLVVTEANTLGTPAVVYNVPGLRDSTRDDDTGIVCPYNNPAALAHAVAELYRDPVRYARLRTNAWAAARALNWDRTARAAWDAVDVYRR